MPILLLCRAFSLAADATLKCAWSRLGKCCGDLNICGGGRDAAARAAAALTWRRDGTTAVGVVGIVGRLRLFDGPDCRLRLSGTCPDELRGVPGAGTPLWALIWEGRLCTDRERDLRT